MIDRSKARSVVQTVSGLLPYRMLGYCQCHEHLFIRKGKSFIINPALIIDDIGKTTMELKMYMRNGGTSIVDAQPVGCGRMPTALLHASKNSGVHIIASTGFHKNLFYKEDHWIFKMKEEQIAQVFIDELQNGMYDDEDAIKLTNKTLIKAGIIKSAIDAERISENYEKLFNAAAYASNETGFSILCHIEKGTDALSVVQFLSSKGVSTSSIILCHLDRAKYCAAYHRELVQTGVYLEYDTIGRFKYHSDEKEIELIIKMIEWGYENRILLGLDTTRERLKNYGGNIGLDYILNCFIPKLLSEGVAKNTIDAFMVKNPQNALSIKI